MEDLAKLGIIVGLLIVMCLLVVLVLLDLDIPDQKVNKPRYIQSLHNLEYLVPRDGRLFASSKAILPLGNINSQLYQWLPVGEISTSGFYNVGTQRYITRNGVNITVGSISQEDFGAVFSIGSITSEIFNVIDPVSGRFLTVGEDCYCYMSERLEEEERQQFEFANTD